MDAANLLASLRKTGGDALHAFLDREFARLPSSLGSSSRHVLRALIFATRWDNETWQGSHAELAEELARVCPAAPRSKPTIKRAIADLTDRGLITTIEQEGKPSVFRIEWRTLLKLQEPPLPEGGETVLTRVNHDDPGQTSIGDPGHGNRPWMTRVMTRVISKKPMFYANDPGHRDPGQALHGVGVGCVNTSPINNSQNPSPSSIPALARADGDGFSKRSRRIGGLWQRHVNVRELRDPEALPGLFDCVVQAGLAKDAEGEFRMFIALVIYALRQEKPVGFLTACLMGTCRDKWERKDWRTRPTTSDIDAAAAMERRIVRPELQVKRPDRYAAKLAEDNAARNEFEQSRARAIAGLRRFNATGSLVTVGATR